MTQEICLKTDVTRPWPTFNCDSFVEVGAGRLGCYYSRVERMMSSPRSQMLAFKVIFRALIGNSIKTIRGPLIRGVDLSVRGELTLACHDWHPEANVTITSIDLIDDEGYALFPLNWSVSNIQLFRGDTFKVAYCVESKKFLEAPASWDNEIQVSLATNHMILTR